MARRGVVVLALAGVVGLLLASHAAAQSAFTAVATASDPGLFLFTSALQLSGLSTFFNSFRNITLFAPSDQALLAALPALNLNQSVLVSNAVLMAPVLMYHAFVPATNNASFPAGVSYYNSLNTDGSVSGNQLAVTRTATGGLRVTSIGSDANVTKVDLPGSGSAAVHVIDAVLFPFYPSVHSAVARTSALSTLSTLFSSGPANLVAKLQDTTGVYTVFAPFNAAFTAALAPSGLNMTIAQLAAQPALLQSILSYHVVPGLYNSSSFSTNPITVTTLTGQQLTLVREGTALVVKTADGKSANLLAARDLPCGFTDQGTFRATVHVVDKVLVPPPIASVAAALALRTDVSTLLAAVRAEGSYVAAINSTTFTGTLLAPTDSAFTSLLAANGSISAAQLLGNTTALKKILDVHVVTGTVLTVAGLTNGQNITTSGGATITVVKTGTVTQLKLGNSVATVVGAEVAIGSSATLLVIDGVLVPSGVATTTSGGGGGGAAAAAAPSFVLMLWSVMAAVLLLGVQRLQ